MTPVRIGLVGVGGYAATYLSSIETLEKENLLELVSVVIRSPQKYPDQCKSLSERGVAIRSSLEEMIERDAGAIEIAAIPTGILDHHDQMIQAVEAGLDVILEKPSAAVIQDVDEMIAALERTGRFCQIGFQNQSDPAVTGLKRLICAGRLGNVKEVIVVGCWQRSNLYYERNNWAGRFKIEDRYLLDGTVNNPFAHYLFNALYFASSERGRAATPATVRAELYRAHDIESEDTSCLEIACDNGTRVYFYATLCGREPADVTIEVLGENGRAVCTNRGQAQLFAGDEVSEEIVRGDTEPRTEVFRNAARYLRGLDAELNCPLAMTRAHVLAVNGAFESARPPVTIPAEHLHVWSDAASGEVFTHIRGIDELLQRAGAERKLYSDLGVQWARQTKPFTLRDYTRFQ